MISTVSEVEYRSSLGTTFRIGGDSPTDYLLHPVFLHFAMMCIAMLAVLDRDGATGPGTGWQMPLIWLIVAVACFLGAIVLSALLSALPRRMIGRRRFTPLILLPLVALAELLRAGMMFLLQAEAWPQMPDLLADFARSMIVVLILDVMHALYVVPLHPLARTEPDQTPEEAPEEPAPPENVTPDAPQSAAPEITIADRRYLITDIQWIRTEDHYLNVVSTKGRSLLRAKLSDLQALQDGKIGMQVNRSQWVAFAAVAEVVEEPGGQINLRLVTGDDATVARSRRLMFRQMMQAWKQQEA